MATVNRITRSYISLHIRSYNSRSHRYSGYINKLIDEQRIGHAVRNDEPQQEYFFSYSDIIVDPSAKTKPYVYQEIEFSIIHSDFSKSNAINITGLNMKPLSNTHHNLFIPRKHKTKHLIDDPQAVHYRHRGVVFKISEDEKQGVIMPDKLYCNALYFHKYSIQSTGIQRLYQWAEVEFDVKPKRNDNEYDQAVCITRPRNQLITAERNILGNRRRYLGSLYPRHSTYANISPDYCVNRKRGYIAHVEPERLYGFILVFDNDTDTDMDPLLHVHVDECHMFGARKLRRFQEVEFIITTNHETGRRMATYVTAPYLELLRYHSENHFVSSSALFKRLDAHKGRYKGIVTKTPMNTYEPYIIKPNDYGHRPVIAYHTSLIALGSQHLQRGDAVEFRINDNLSTQNEALQRAFDVTSLGGYPLLLQDGEYGKYLQSKIGLESNQKLLPQYGDNDESLYDVNGYIASYNKENQYGFIEIIAPHNVRYKRMVFYLKDAVLKYNNVDYSQYQPLHAAQNKVIFTVVHMDDFEHQVKTNVSINKKAINIVTEGKNYVDMCPIKIKKDIKKRKSSKKILNASMFAQCIECKTWKHQSLYTHQQWKMKLNDRKCQECVSTLQMK